MRIEIVSWAQAEPHAEGFELDDLDKDCVHAMRKPLGG